MRKTLITIAVLGGAYYVIYQIWKNSKKKQEAPPTSNIIEETIAIAKSKPKVNGIIEDNREVFKSMRQPFNSEESATVAPSINAKIGIF